MFILEWLVGQGAVIVVPIFLLILSLIFRADMKQALAGALKIAVGFTALNGLLGIIFGGMEPAAAAMADRFAAGFTILDIGWPTQTAMGWAIPWGMFAVLGFFLLNLICLLLGRMKTLNADFNNYWTINTFMFYIVLLTGNWVLAIASGIIYWFVCMKLADWFAPCIGPYYKLPLEGISIPHYASINWAPIGFLMDKVWDKIPGINKVNWSAEKIQSKFGFFGEPLFMGFLVGSVVGIMAYVKMPFTLDMLGQILGLGFSVAFFMHFIPRAAEMVISGMSPISEAIRNFCAKHLPGKEYYIGLDVAVLVGAPEHAAIGVLTTPIAFLLAFLLPGNRVLPMGDVAGLFIFICVFLCNTNKGNIFRGLLNSTLILMPIVFYSVNYLTPVNMEFLAAINYALPEGATLIISLCMGCYPMLFGLMLVSLFIGGVGAIPELLFGLGLIALTLVPWYLMRNRPEEYAKELLAADAAEEAY